MQLKTRVHKNVGPDRVNSQLVMTLLDMIILIQIKM